MKPPHRIEFLDSLRAIAALWVVLYHFSEGGAMPALAAALPPQLKHILFDLGYLGVPVFFVLSGAVMAATTAQTPMLGAAASRFVLRRLIRLTPPYYAAIAAGLLIMWAKSWLEAAALPSPADIAAHLVYAQGFFGVRDIVSVFWTLGIEVQFYIAFALILWIADALGLHRALAMSASAVIALPWAFGWWTSPLWPGGFLHFWFAFMAGVLCGRFLAGSGDWRMAAAYAALVMLGGFCSNDGLYAITAATTVAILLLTSQWGALRQALTVRWLQLIGLVSYSLYLFHVPTIGPVMRLMRKFMASSVTTDILALLVVTAGCLGVATLAYRLIERPAIGWSRRIIPRGPVRSPHGPGL